MKTLITNWNFFRLIRLLLGVAVVIKGATDGEVVFVVAGGMVALMALADIGCCGNNGCPVPISSHKETGTKQNNNTYEELVSTK